MKSIINVRYYDFHTYKENMFVVFDETIIHIGEMTEFIDEGYMIIDGKNKLLMPSLVVGHTHLYSKLSRGMSSQLDPNNFKEILEQLWWKLDRQLDNDMNYYSGVVGASDYALNGVTTIIDHHASGEITGSLKALSYGVIDIGLRGIYCFETSDRFDIDLAIDENLYFLKKYNPYQAALFGFHASFTLSDETLEKVSKVIGNYPIHIHVAESRYDVEDSIKYHKSIIQRLDDFNLLNKDSIIVHGIYLSDEDLDLIRERECVIAVNVTSNMNNGVGIIDYKRMKNHGVTVIIGNDGLSSSITTEYLNLYYVSHLKEGNITGFSLDDLKEVIVSTYEYVNRRLDVKIGRIEEGYTADLLLHDFLIPTPINKDNILGHLFFGYFNSFKPSDVFVSGNCIVRNYALVEDVSELYKESSRQASKLWKRFSEEE
jgi:putative selenium metabolism protein SsnA